MEYTDGKWKKNSTDWDELMSTSLLDREAVIEGAVHSIRNMGDVAFIILRKREGLFQTVLENKIPDCSVHQLKEAIDIFENSSWIREILGEDFCRIYVESKKKEWLRYTRQVTDWEVEEYLYRL